MWIIFIVAIIALLTVKAVNNANRRSEKRVISTALELVMKPITPQLVLNAGIPLKPKTSLKGAYADSLARHVKIYLKQNPDEAARYIDLTKGEDTPEEVLSYEMMLEHSQYLRTIILRAVLNIKQRNWEFCSAIDEPRLSRLVNALETDPEAYFLQSSSNDTIRQGEEPQWV